METGDRGRVDAVRGLIEITEENASHKPFISWALRMDGKNDKKEKRRNP
jgi:hypothetical protein